MKAERFGFVSAILASSCCVLPLSLALLGLGGLGLGSVIGAYHWYLIAGAVALLGAAWWYFLGEKRRLEAIAADVKNERTTRLSLTVASAAQGSVTVRMEPGAVSLDAIAGAIRAAGYEPVVGAVKRES
jgi:mercuric ion transport protein